MSTLSLSILSPERRLIENLKVGELTLTGSEGQIQILPGHAPMVGTLETGIFHYQAGAESSVTGLISSGFFHVISKGDDTEVSLLAETLELKAEIDVERARRAQKTAEDALKDANLEEGKFKKYQLKLQRAMIRQQVAGREAH